MNSRWFANRGQMLQIVLAALGCFIAAINAWPNFKLDELFAIGPVIFYLLMALFAVLAVRTFGPKPSASSPLPPVTTPPSAPAPAWRVRRAKTFTFTLRIGTYWEPPDPDFRVRITLNGIAPYALTTTPRMAERKPEFSADLTVSGAGLITGGALTSQVDTTRFLVPAASGPLSQEQFSLFAFEFSKSQVGFSGIRVEHINPHTNEAEIVYASSYLWESV
jgi:hypothetical protein